MKFSTIPYVYLITLLLLILQYQDIVKLCLSKHFNEAINLIENKILTSKVYLFY